MKDILLALCGVGVGVALVRRNTRRVFIGPPTITINSSIDADSVRRAMSKAKAECVAEVAAAVRRGGSFRKAVRG